MAKARKKRCAQSNAQSKGVAVKERKGEPKTRGQRFIEQFRDPRCTCFHPLKDLGRPFVIGPLNPEPPLYLLTDEDISVLSEASLDWTLEYPDWSAIEAILIQRFGIRPADCPSLTVPQMVALFNHPQGAPKTVELNGTEKKLVKALGDKKAFGSTRITQENVTTLAGFRDGSSQVKHALARLKEKGIVDNTYRKDRRPGNFLTAAGKQVFFDSQP